MPSSFGVCWSVARPTGARMPWPGPPQCGSRRGGMCGRLSSALLWCGWWPFVGARPWSSAGAVMLRVVGVLVPVLLRVVCFPGAVPLWVRLRRLVLLRVVWFRGTVLLWVARSPASVWPTVGRLCGPTRAMRTAPPRSSPCAPSASAPPSCSPGSGPTPPAGRCYGPPRMICPISSRGGSSPSARAIRSSACGTPTPAYGPWSGMGGSSGFTVVLTGPTAIPPKSR